MKWVEGTSRDTVENAQRSIGLMKADKVTHVVIVTSGLHMQRALAAFKRAAHGQTIELEQATMNVALRTDKALYAWIPSPEGYANVHVILREWMVRLSGG